MTRKRIFNWIGFTVTGLAGGVILIIISELTKFSHVNFIPFGGYSWAIWFYPVAFGISFSIAAKLFKKSNFILVLIIVTMISIIIFYFLTQGLLFTNPLPFGINAGPVL